MQEMDCPHRRTFHIYFQTLAYVYKSFMSLFCVFHGIDHLFELIVNLMLSHFGGTIYHVVSNQLYVYDFIDFSHSPLKKYNAYN